MAPLGAPPKECGSETMRIQAVVAELAEKVSGACIPAVNFPSLIVGSS